MGNMSSKNTINDPSYQGLKATGGEAHVRTSGAPGTLETIVFTCDADGDLMTDPADPETTEIFWANGLTGKTRIRFTFHAPNEGATVPYAVAARVCVNAGSEADSITALTMPDYGAQAASRTTFGTSRMISQASPVAEYDLAGTDATVADFAVGFIPPTQASADAVYVSVEVW